MSEYIVVLAGTGIKISSVPSPITGFVATRRVSAANKGAAAENAINAIRAEVESAEWFQSNFGGPLRLSIESLRKVRPLERLWSSAPTKGYTFYYDE